MSRSFRRMLARNRQKPLVRSFARQIKSWQRSYENFDYDLHHNVEGFLIKVLTTPSDAEVTMFDVGANVGEWSQLCLDTSPNTKVHAFELVPNTAERLEKNLSHHPMVEVNAFGFSDAAGKFPVKINVDEITRLTLITNADLGAVNTDEIVCSVRTGDEYLSQNKIDHIDLLKIDAEGADHLVLKSLV
jgi:FkbM family methyltransferase